jgi:hypothetical protein
VGRDIYHMITDTSCEFSNIQVGDEIPAQPGNNQLGNVKHGRSQTLDTEFGRADVEPRRAVRRLQPRRLPESHPRVSLVPIYDPSTYNPPGTDDVTVTGFHAGGHSSGYETCWKNRASPTAPFPGTANDHSSTPWCSPRRGSATGDRGAVHRDRRPAAEAAPRGAAAARLPRPGEGRGGRDQAGAVPRGPAAEPAVRRGGAGARAGAADAGDARGDHRVPAEAGDPRGAGLPALERMEKKLGVAAGGRRASRAR